MSLQTPDRPSPASKGKQKEEFPQPTDIAEKFIAYTRRNAVATRPKDRSERIPPATTLPTDKRLPPLSGSRSPKKLHASPALISKSPDAPADEFSRKLQISSSPSPARTMPSGPRQNQASKLYNPDRDPIPTMRRTAEPDAMSDTDSSHAPRYKRSPSATRERERDAPARQLFDHRKDDPVRFAVLARPQQKQRPVPTSQSSGGYISAASSVSSSFTLSSATDDSSAASAIFDQSRPNARSEDSATHVFSDQLKRLYRNITSLESKIRDEDVDIEDDNRFTNRILRKGKGQIQEDEEAERQKWTKRIEDHKRLVEYIHNMLEISLSPSVPSSLRDIPRKYNIIMRLWVTGFHKILQSLQRACLESPLAMEFLQGFIIYAYTFYTGLYEEYPLRDFRSNWLEALGDLARYRMTVAAMTAGSNFDGLALTAANVSEAAAHAMDAEKPAIAQTKAVSDVPAARIDDSPSPSVGVAAARALELLPEKVQWRCIAEDWYGIGLTHQPGQGKLHHHLGFLYREVEGEELRAVYHFVKSMVSTHPFLTSRENVLHVWSPEAQARRQVPDARVPELFVLLHGMLFTNIQLDDFKPTFSRFMECLDLEGAEERQWMMMAIINIGSLFEYGKDNGVLKQAGAPGSASSAASSVSRIAKKGVQRDDDKMDVDDDSKPRPNVSPRLSEPDKTSVEPPTAFKLALELTFTMLRFVLLHPTRKPSHFSKSKLNPYLTALLTFISIMLKQQKTREILERSIPWDELAALYAVVPRNTVALAGLSESSGQEERRAMLASGTSPPLPEDWFLRGMEWVGRKIYPQGYWKETEEHDKVEIGILGEPERVDETNGHIEDDNQSHSDSVDVKERKNRWIRIVRCVVDIAAVVEGFKWVEGTKEWRVEGVLADKVRQWKEEDRVEKESEERRRMRCSWGEDLMDVDEYNVENFSDGSEEDDENDTEEIRALKERRRYLRQLLQSEATPRRLPRSSRKEQFAHPPLPIVAGYTVLVIDTNILLSSLSMFASLVESNCWTVVVPLPVVMELDGLKSNISPALSEAARTALDYITSHIRSHSLSLKIQTSKGNYLSNLNFRTEDVDFTSDRTMDDLILKAAIWHDEHWSNRSVLLQAKTPDLSINPVKVVLVSLDRNLRLKARSRQLPAASEKDLALLFATGT
ncbi:hypothetical protein GGU10DRAFT_384891 [Lentinula aff. detonsa]|uniref:PIN domain-containing protein n=1 Tax=Lentinula aff. detonsa TaxID=2804958 RepID=A0AA38NLB4_9AGAR|nr:hypothetical protein GGU10DRAFT_384891 [Lentinula aff. detonsa]